MAKSRTDPGGAPLSDRMLRHPILSRDEERGLLVRAASGDAEARDALVAANMRFILSFAKRHGPRNGLEVEDALQEGAIGELKAVGKFDVGKGYRLSTYASWWVRQAIQRAGQETGRTIRLTAPMLANIRILERACAEAEAAGIVPTEADLMAATGFDEEELRSVAEAAAISTVSLDAPITENGHTLADVCGDPATGPASTFEHVERQERSLAVREALACLTPLERAVVRSRYEDDLTLEETAAKVAPMCEDRRTLSRERIRQIQKHALLKLRAAMATTGAN
ncbi:MAG TPA: sigma-70 family RNA polymerase sigma factor [Patescibacteria group bacterium]|nr:sigma-70 family RNA polymerase sigma factor [Patescibacteria group bacterium]